MKHKRKHLQSVSELRQDIVSGDWVVVATGRGKRPHDFLKQKRTTLRQTKKLCPFEHLRPSNILASYSLHKKTESENWITVISNKYPAFGRGVCSLFHTVGPYQWTEGVGSHELVVTRDHSRSFAQMSQDEAELVIRAYQDRYLALKDGECAEYISIFHNHGLLAGASIAHPHSQIIAIPVIPPDIARSILGSAHYFSEKHACVHCVMIRHELREKKRLVYENNFFLLFAPFASKASFELRIFPKKHQPHFEIMVEQERRALADILLQALGRLSRGLKDTDYNFFIHTAPTKDTKEFHHYHWHIEILPKTGIWAGFEIGTGIEISTIAPEAAAKFLRQIKV